MARRENSEINAGSMADIAFLLLIFFLVTTTMDTDSGVFRKLPEKQPPTEDKGIEIKQKNILEVVINRSDEILVDEEPATIKDIRQLAINFIDNSGGRSVTGEICNYCEGREKSFFFGSPK